MKIKNIYEVLRTGESLPAENKDCYELHVKTMHGDGDVYKTDVFKFKSYETTRLYKTIYCLGAFFAGNRLTNRETDYIEEYIRPLLQKIDYYGDDKPIDTAHDFLYDYVGLDSTYDGNYASMQKLSVFYYDLDGAKFRMDFKLGDIWRTELSCNDAYFPVYW